MHSVGVDVVGLQGTGLVLQNNGADDLAVSADGAIVFATPVPSGAPYDVTVQAQPTASPAEICEVDAGSGTVTNATITGIAVTCRKLVGRFAYVANAGSKTISGFSIDAQTGELTELAGSPFPVTGSAPLAPVADPSGSFLYVLGDDTFGTPDATTLTGFEVDPDTGVIAAIPGMPIAHPATASPIGNPIFHPSGKFMYLTVSELTAAAENGLYAYAIDPATGELAAISGSPHKLGATQDHALRNAVVPQSGEFLYVVHGSGMPLAESEIAIFAIDEASGALSPAGSASLGKTANQLVLHPSGTFLLTRNADASMSLLAIDALTGQLSQPVSVPGAPGAGAAFAFGGRYMYLLDPGNIPPPGAGTGSVLGFAVDEATAALTPLPQSPYATNGQTSLAPAVDPTSRYLTATNFDSGTIAAFSIDENTGELSYVPGSPFTPIVTGNQGGVFFDPSGTLLYLPSGLPTGGALSSYRIDAAAGLPVFIGSQPTGAGTSGINVAILGLH